MTKPPTRHDDIDDCDFIEDEKMEDENVCPDCEGYKNMLREKCDGCIYSE